MFLSILVTALAATAVSGMSYTKESMAGDGKKCIEDCVNYRCITGWKSAKEPCIPGTKAALKYYTARRESDKKVCASRCGKHGYDYYWCYVSDDDWDYCDPNVIDEVKTKVFTNSKGPCKDECGYRGEKYKWCYTYWNSWDYCDHDDEYRYVQSQSLEAAQCVGVCGAHEQKSFNWCFDEQQARRYCAPPARDVSELENTKAEAYSKLASKVNKMCPGLPKPDRQERSITDGEVGPGFVDSHVELYELPDNGLVTVNLYERANPVYRYTVVPAGYADEPELPLVVRARITRDTVRPRGTRRSSLPARVVRNLQRMGLNRDRYDNNNDEIGHLIGFQNGGTNDIYNLAPQPRRLNRDCTHDAVCQQQSVWYWTEMSINNFVRSTGGSVNMTVVVLYRNMRSEPRPDGYVVNLNMYNPDGSTHYQCNDYFYSNDPESDSN